MYEITVRLPTKKIERLITQLFQKGYYQTCYEVPLDVVTDANGYAFVEKRNDLTELNIYIDNYVEAKERRKLSEILAIDESRLVIKEVNEFGIPILSRLYLKMLDLNWRKGNEATNG